MFVVWVYNKKIRSRSIFWRCINRTCGGIKTTATYIFLNSKHHTHASNFDKIDKRFFHNHFKERALASKETSREILCCDKEDTELSLQNSIKPKTFKDEIVSLRRKKQFYAYN